MAEVFELAISVKPEDIDELGHVNNVSYVRWVQDVAVAHWRSAAPAEDQAKLLWVVVRHEIDYKQAAFLGDEILARTWVGGATRITFERHTDGACWPRHARCGARSTRARGSPPRSARRSGRGFRCSLSLGPRCWC
jgi:acyl-ACP thioesterase